MQQEPLKLIVVARDGAPAVRAAWDELEPIVREQAGITIVAVDAGDLDLTAYEAELVVVLGGDGSILRACRLMGARQMPILGVNLGRFGFLADLSPDEFQKHLPTIAARDFRVVDHLMYQCTLTRGDGSQETHLGLNEVIISSGASFAMIDVKLEIDGEPVTTYSGDGVIVSTPVGSTAHSLSAGGPLLRQHMQAFVITPVCPHTLTNRPLVDRAECLYTLTVPRCVEGVTLVLDGQVKIPLTAEDHIELTRAAVSFQLAKVPGHSYYSTLHRKLGWGGQPRYREAE